MIPHVRLSVCYKFLKTGSYNFMLIFGHLLSGHLLKKISPYPLHFYHFLFSFPQSLQEFMLISMECVCVCVCVFVWYYVCNIPPVSLHNETFLSTCAFLIIPDCVVWGRPWENKYISGEKSVWDAQSPLHFFCDQNFVCMYIRLLSRLTYN